VACFFEQGNESLGSMKGVEFTDKPENSRFLRIILHEVRLINKLRVGI
jgi:hypothetical protein